MLATAVNNGTIKIHRSAELFPFFLGAMLLFWEPCFGLKKMMKSDDDVNQPSFVIKLFVIHTLMTYVSTILHIILIHHTNFPSHMPTL